MKKVIVALLSLTIFGTVHTMRRARPTRTVKAILGKALRDVCQAHTSQASLPSEELSHELRSLRRQIEDSLEDIQTLFKTSIIPIEVRTQAKSVIRQINVTKKKLNRSGLSYTANAISNLHMQISDLYQPLATHEWPQEKLACLRVALGDISDILTDQSFVCWLKDVEYEDFSDKEESEYSSSHPTREGEH